MLQFVLATGNADKVREITEILGDALARSLVAVPVISPEATAVIVTDDPDASREPHRLDISPNVIEDGGTLEANARIKAAAWCSALGLPAIADDTGLFVDALDGGPGVDTAYYAGPDATYEENVAKLLGELDGLPDDARGAHFATIALAVFPDGREVIAEGRADGRIAASTGGAVGFGYDPVFIPVAGDGRRFAEMTLAEKHAASHRGRAFRALAAALAAADLDAAPAGRGD